MAEIICPLCGKPNPPELDECQYCQAPLKSGGFLPPAPEDTKTEGTAPSSEGEDKAGVQPSTPQPSSYPEESIPDWLKATEAGFTQPSEEEPEATPPEDLSEQIDSIINPLASTPTSQEDAVDDEWLDSLLTDAGAREPEELSSEEEPAEKLKAEPEPSTEEMEQEVSSKEEQPPSQEPVEKPDWLANLEAASTIKLEGGMFGAEPGQEEIAPKEVPEEESPEPMDQPDWLTKVLPEEQPEGAEETEEGLAAAELPTWLEALRPSEAASPTGPVEDISSAEVVTAGPLSGLRGVISAQPSAIRPQKPPTYSIKLRVTDEQQARMQMMEELLADEGKPKPLPAQHVITSQNILRLIIAIALLLPMVWLIIGKSQQTSMPQPGNVPGVVDFTQSIQKLPSGAVVLVAFDYEAGFAGEMNLAVTNVISQLMNKNAYLTLVSTISSGPAMAESVVKTAYAELSGAQEGYMDYANLGYIPGGTMGLLGLVNSPKSVLPYSLDGSNVWAGAPLNGITSIEGFSAVVVMTNDPDVARIWIEQAGPKLLGAGTPLLIVTSAQAEPLIRPYFESSPAQVQGLIAGLTGGIAYARTFGNTQMNGEWDAFSAGITISVLILLVGSIAGILVKMLPDNRKKET
jgi:hypothetical protein